MNGFPPQAQTTSSGWTSTPRVLVKLAATAALSSGIPGEGV